MCIKNRGEVAMLEAYKQRVMVDFVNNHKGAIMTSQDIADELRNFVSRVTRFRYRRNGVDTPNRRGDGNPRKGAVELICGATRTE